MSLLLFSCCKFSSDKTGLFSYLGKVKEESMKKSLYHPVSEKTLKIIEEINCEEKPTFLIPTRFISRENAQLAFLLNEYYNYGRELSERHIYRSFFVSSHEEAFQGAVKLIRHHGFKAQRHEILLLDMQKSLEELIDPFEDESVALIPGLTGVRDCNKLMELIQTKENLLGVIIVNTDQEHDYASIFRVCKEKGIISLWMDSDHDPNSPFKPCAFPVLPDIVILGESFTNYEVPFAVFSMSQEIHKPWAKMVDSLLHSSTYSGNKLSVLVALRRLMETSWFQQQALLEKECKDIEHSAQNTIKAFAKYINPGMVKLYKILGYDFICEHAHGSIITIQDSKGALHTAVDAVSGGGAAICGHSPKTVCTKSCDDYRKQDKKDFMGQLEEQFSGLLSLPHCFPAVSGATAVENALKLAILANDGKRRIITFDNNYGGNTLISLICTGDEELHQLFAPNYGYATYLDPYAEDVTEQLEHELEEGDVALIWMELVQGGSLEEIPDKVLQVIQEKQKEYHYYIGIDEILMGFYRLGERTSYMAKPIEPDIVTFSKALTGSSFPMAVTLVSSKVYDNALLKNSDLVKDMKSYYMNQFGANMALNSIEQLEDPAQIHQAEKVGKILEKGFREIFNETQFFSEIKGKGHIYALEYKEEWMSYYFINKCYHYSKIFLVFTAIGTCVLAQVTAPQFIAIFTEPGTDVYTLALQGIRILSIAFIFTGINIFASGMFTAYGNGKLSAVISLSNDLVIVLITLLILPQFWGINGIWAAIPLAEALTAVISITIIYRKRENYCYTWKLLKGEG